VARLRAVGIGEAVVVDLTKPEFGIPVVRAVVPRMEFSAHGDDYRPGDRGRAFRAVQP
jgi:ribosomal protein S12 methylthiotransferase accessory factor